MFRIDSAASGGNRGKPRDCMKFLWPPREAVLSISNFISYL